MLIIIYINRKWINVTPTCTGCMSRFFSQNYCSYNVPFKKKEGYLLRSQGQQDNHYWKTLEDHITKTKYSEFWTTLLTSSLYGKRMTTGSLIWFCFFKYSPKQYWYYLHVQWDGEREWPINRNWYHLNL